MLGNQQHIGRKHTEKYRLQELVTEDMKFQKGKKRGKREKRGEKGKKEEKGKKRKEEKRNSGKESIFNFYLINNNLKVMVGLVDLHQFSVKIIGKNIFCFSLQKNRSSSSN